MRKSCCYLYATFYLISVKTCIFGQIGTPNLTEFYANWDDPLASMTDWDEGMQDFMLNKKYSADEPSTVEAFQKNITDHCPFLRSNGAAPSYQGLEVIVLIKYELLAFFGTDDVKKVLSQYAKFTFSWQLPACARWENSKDQPGSIFFPNDKLWRPVAYVENSRSREDVFKEYASDFRLSASGRMQFEVKTIFETSCDFDFKKFPFDEQTCQTQLSFNNEARTRRRAVSIYVNEENFSKSVWLLKNKSFELTNGLQMMFFKLTLKRRAVSYAGNLFAPTTLLAVLQLSSLIMPPEKPDRPALSVTVLISISVYQTILNDQLPQTSQVLNIMIYYNAQLAIAIGITVYSLVICRLMSNREKRHSLRELCCFDLITVIDLIEVVAAIVFIALYLSVNFIFFANIDFY